ncbi:DUF7507 domain-containing protein [Flavobacterium sp.]|uniref:DUF7507 domain-containing protein n=1 Tax=Flavobacterium sp. TaxID=239 RepID=UPI003C663E3A
MKKILHLFTSHIQGIKKIHFVSMFLFVTSLIVGQTITTSKTITSSSCGVIDVQLGFTGVNPAKGPVEVILVIDVSGSMGSSSGSPTSLSRAQDAAVAFVNKILATPTDTNGLNPTGLNRVGLVSFSGTASLKRALTSYTSKSNLLTEINNLTAGGSTNNQDGLVKADKEFTDNGTFNCNTTRSIVLLTDGVTNVTGSSGSTTNCSTPTYPATSTCITAAIQAATNAKTTQKGSPSVTYNNQIFSIGLFGGISGNNQQVAEYTLKNISTSNASPYYFQTESAADLTTIYTQIANQLNWVAKDLIVTETIPTGYGISSVTSSSGSITPATIPITGPATITWTNNLLTTTPITLNYKLTPNGTVCGTQKVSTTGYKYVNSTCTEVTNQSVATDDYFINCKPVLTGASSVCTGDTGSVYSVPNISGHTYSWNVVGGIITAGTGTNSITVIWGAAGVGKVDITETISGCSLTTTQNVTINPLPVVSAGSPFTKSCTNNIAGGTIGETAEAGHTYAWTSSPSGFTSSSANPFVNPTVTTIYTVVKKNSTTGCTATANVTVTVSISTPSASITAQTNVNCFGGNNGSVTVAGANGTPNYTYSKDGTTFVASGAFANLIAGSYTITVKDANGCTTTQPVTITQPAAALSASITAQTNVNCLGGDNGSVTVVGANGTPNYTYSKDGTTFVASGTFANLIAGSYTITVKDANGCTTTQPVTITQPSAPINCSITQNKAVSANGLSDGQATVTPIGGNGGYTYLWDNNETTAIAIALNVGSHSVTVTDSKGCNTTCQVTITQPNVLACNITQNAPAKCYGDSNGIATVTPLGGNGEYTYLWDNNETTAQAVALNGGTHSVTVKDKLGYTTTCEVITGQPQAPLTATAVIVNNHNCIGCANGSINITPLGGTSPYTYTWSNGATTEDISFLPKGKYDIEIKDANDCTANYTYYISESEIEILKDAVYEDTNKDGITNAFDKIIYNFKVTNTGNVTLTGITVTDSKAIISGGPITLEPGMIDDTTFKGEHIIVQEDIDKGFYYNIALAKAKDNENNDVNDTSSDITPCTTCPIDPECPDCTITDLEKTPKLSITKTALSASYSVIGDEIKYLIVIKNTGNQTLHQVVVTDPLTKLNVTILTLDPGETKEYNQTYIVTAEDLKVDSILNVANIKGVTPDNKPIEETDDAIVNKKTNQINAVNDSFDNIGCNKFGTVGNVLANDQLNTTQATIQLVYFTLNSGGNPNITIDPASGDVIVGSATPAGIYTYSYKICEKTNPDNCDDASVTITVLETAPITIKSEACNADTATVDLNSLLPTDIDTTGGTWIDTTNSNALNGSFFSPYQLALRDYTFEYKITNGNCPRSIFVIVTVNFDCKVLGCQSIIVHNAFSPNNDGLNEVFKIDGIDDIICYPTNSVAIYNRWGILVYETQGYDNVTKVFKGFSEGRTTVSQSTGLSAGTYFYILHYTSFDGSNNSINNTKDGYLYLTK